MPDATHNFHALVIGVGTYIQHGFKNLPATVKDARGLRDILVDPQRCAYPPAQVHCLVEEEATLPRMRKELALLTTVGGLGSTVLIFFSGHGWRLSEQVTGRNDNPGYLCLREADLLDMDHKALSEAEFSLALHGIKADRVVVILDCCHAGSTAILKGPSAAMLWKSGLSKDFYNTLAQGAGRVFMASCEDDEQSYVRPQKDYSVFTYHLLDALRGAAGVGQDGVIRVFDVCNYVSHKTSSDVQETPWAYGPDARQTPIFNVVKANNFALALGQPGQAPAPGGAATAPAGSPPPQPQVIHGSQFNNTIHANHVNSYSAHEMNFNAWSPPAQRNTGAANDAKEE